MDTLASYAISLHAKNSEWLGFIPSSRIEAYAEANQIIAEYENGDLCGYLIYGNGWPVMRIYQACIEECIRNLGHGRNLVAKATVLAEQARCSSIILGCRASNDSLWFWETLGFTPIGITPGGRRKSPVVKMELPVNGQGNFFSFGSQQWSSDVLTRP